MQRRKFIRNTLATTAAAALARTVSAQAAKSPVRIGVDIYSLQNQNFTPFQSLDYCHNLGVKVVHFSEIRFLGSLDPENLKRVRARAGAELCHQSAGVRSAVSL